jgi:hypothetical protein
VKYIPYWFPDSSFKQTARKYAKTVTDLVEEPFAFTKHQIARNKHVTSLASNLIEQGENDEVSKWIAGALYSAGADTICICKIDYL